MCQRAAAQTGQGTADGYAADPDGRICAVALQVDGKILLGGAFRNVRGFPRSALARLNPDGSLDKSFDPGARLGTNAATVYSLAVQTDGRILVGGDFTTLAGNSRTNIGRLNANGSIDPSFNPGADEMVRCLVALTNGKVLVGGWFRKLGGQTHAYLGRLNSNGTLDASFSPSVDSGVLSLAVQADQKAVVGGSFTKGIVRLDPNGGLDGSFGGQVAHPFGGYVCSLAIAANGQILVGGFFNQLGSLTRTNIGRVNSNGSADASFNLHAIAPNPFGFNGSVDSLAVQSDGSILVGGDFTTLAGQPRRNLGRVTSSGASDNTFLPEPDGNDPRVECLAVQPDGKILVGGYFSRLTGQSRNNLGRLLANGTFDPEFNPPTIAGPIYPAPWGANFTYSGTLTDDQIGKEGKAWYFSNIPLGDKTVTFWGPTNGGVKMSFDDIDYTGTEILTYRSDLSSLADGKAVWSGQTLTPAPARVVYTRFTLAVTHQTTGLAVPLTEAGSLRLPAGIGALVRVTNGLAFKAVLLFEASYVANSQFQPAFHFFNNITNTPKTCHSSITAGFYYNPGPLCLNRIVHCAPTMNNVAIRFQDLPTIPPRPYTLLRSADLNTWQQVIGAVADTNGVIQFVDTTPPAGRAFYRVRSQ